jgi:hypothetical protein
MWTRRKLFPTLDVPVLPQPAAVTTPYFLQQHKNGPGDLTLEEGAYNFIASLHYTLVPSLSPQEAAQLLSWALPQIWVAAEDETLSGIGKNTTEAAYRTTLATLLKNGVIMQSCSQVEYFFFGTDNGQVFQMPLLPPHLLECLMTEAGEALLPGLASRYRRETQLLRQASSDSAVQAAMRRVPVNCVGRRLLHRHLREEPVTAIDHLGVLCASAAPSADHAVALSIFHPTPVGVVCLTHPCPVRSLKLWEGSAFTSSADGKSGDVSIGNEDSATALRQRWSQHMREAEPVAVYIFTGDDAGVVRLWRVDVVARTYSLQHVLVCSHNMIGMRSPLSPFAREDTTKKVPSRDSSLVLHCLEIDVAGNRLFGGTEGGAYVWALNELPWRGVDETPPTADHPTKTSDTHSTNSGNSRSDWLAVQHPLCYDEAHRTPLRCALQCWDTVLPSTSPPAADAESAVVEYRAARLVNHHVWIADAAAVQAEMTRAQQMHQEGGVAVSGWKPKYGRVITGGAAVGVVSNTVSLKEARKDDGVGGVASRLTNTVITVTFDGGELRNDLRVPLSCVLPVVYPLAFLRTPGTACFALRVLSSQQRVVTSCADGKICVWVRKPAADDASAAASAETYVPQLVTENHQEHRGLGRHLYVMRSPDVFVSCSFDDGLVKEWHVYDEPELLLRCARRFTLVPHVSDGSTGTSNAQELANMFKSITQSGQEDMTKTKTAEAPATAAGHTDDAKSGHSSSSSDSGSDGDEVLKAAEGGDVVAGISCAAAYPVFGALFLVGAFESAIQAYTLTEVVGCEPPRNFIYNGHKTVRLPASMAEDVYQEL